MNSHFDSSIHVPYSSPACGWRLLRGKGALLCNGLAVFLAVVAVVVSMKFRLKIAGRGPHAHVPCPGLCWCRGPRWRRGQRLPASCHEAPSGPPPWAAPGGLYPAAPGPQVSCSEPLGLAHRGLDGRPPSNPLLLSAGLGAPSCTSSASSWW